MSLIKFCKSFSFSFSLFSFFWDLTLAPLEHFHFPSWRRRWRQLLCRHWNSYPTQKSWHWRIWYLLYRMTYGTAVELCLLLTASWSSRRRWFIPILLCCSIWCRFLWAVCLLRLVSGVGFTIFWGQDFGVPLHSTIWSSSADSGTNPAASQTTSAPGCIMNLLVLWHLL